ncbi:DUF4118 domain-containing protein [Nocardioides sp. WL0053]|uniref:DUF4118 domain-containing protein n=1 Tax=Nocardioides jiangsuensis TaxID=2866161 RepID=A0ABS7RQR3_9ACTN|nr:DUF4118 domain-containing protein [Nocardioides jiangsuensis]MBY9076839.1 DUF4118 domain-containing protein [Nocardioides jiangsuensis]
MRVGAVLAPLLVCAAMSLRREAFTNSTAVLVLATVIVAVASACDRYAGVLAAVSSGAWFDFFLTEPYLRFTIDDPDDIGDMVLLVVIGLAVTEIALWDEREQARASGRTGPPRRRPRHRRAGARPARLGRRPDRPGHRADHRDAGGHPDALRRRTGP